MPFIGPAVPAHLQKSSSSRGSSDDEKRRSMIGPPLPSQLLQSPGRHDDDDSEKILGPSLPPHLQKISGRQGDDDDDDSEKILGPSLPPHLQKISGREDDDDSEKILGPSLPPHLQKLSSGRKWDSDTRSMSCSDYLTSRHSDQIQAAAVLEPVFEGPALPPDYHKKQAMREVQKTSDRTLGPALPPSMKKSSEKLVLGMTQFEQQWSNTDDSNTDDSDLDELIGPLPATDCESHTSYASREIERRAIKMKDNLLGKNEAAPVQRESWMLELPPERSKIFGLGPRKFSTSKSTAKRDKSWLETPGDDKNKECPGETSREVAEPTARALARRDEMMVKLVGKHSGQRSQSLLEIHQKNRKRKMKDKSKPQERRPFDRELDLQTNRIDEAQKQSIIKKSRELGNRFSHGKVQKFL